MWVIGRVKPRSTDFVLDYTKQVDISPWRYVLPVGLAICALVVFVYVYFAQ
ncbi:MAG: hypothetical protein ABGW97_08110 [Christiangramia sp.]